jgi:hypothetical protein
MPRHTLARVTAQCRLASKMLRGEKIDYDDAVEA